MTWDGGGFRCENLTLVRRQSLVLPFIALLTLGVLTGCRAEPSIAAYVGDLSISTDQLAAAIDARMADPNIAAVVEPGDAEYQRLVLFQLVRQAEYRLLSDAYEVDVRDREVLVWLDDQLAQEGAPSRDDFYANAASNQQLSEIDVLEYFRQLLIRQEIAAVEGLDGPTQDATLRARYEEIKNQVSTIEVGFITVPDQDAADVILAALLADPGSYPALAAANPGPNTVPSVTSSSIADLPADLLPSVLQTAVGQGFTLAVPDAGVVVGYVASLDVPTFEAVEAQIRAEAAGGVDGAAAEVVSAFVADLDIDINPRYGSLGDEAITPESGGVVQILEDAGTR